MKNGPALLRRATDCRQSWFSVIPNLPKARTSSKAPSSPRTCSEWPTSAFLPKAKSGVGIRILKVLIFQHFLEKDGLPRRREACPHASGALERRSDHGIAPYGSQ